MRKTYYLRRKKRTRRPILVMLFALGLGGILAVFLMEALRTDSPTIPSGPTVAVNSSLKCRRSCDAEKCDIFEVLAHVAYARTVPLTREERVTRALTRA